MKSLEILDKLIEKEILCFGTSVIDEEIEIIKEDLKTLEMLLFCSIIYEYKMIMMRLV